MDYQDFASKEIKNDLDFLLACLTEVAEERFKETLNTLVNTAFDCGYEEGKEAEENARDDAFIRNHGEF